MVTPLVGIDLDGATIALSATREDVERALGQGDADKADPKRLYYFESELRFDFDEDDEVEFIEFLGGIDGRIQPMVYGAFAFQVDADVLFGLLSENSHGPVDEDEGGYSCAFLDIAVGMYRPIVPRDVEEALEQSAVEGDSWSEALFQDEWRKASHWETLGIGVQGYYR